MKESCIQHQDLIYINLNTDIVLESIVLKKNCIPGVVMTLYIQA